MISFKLRNIRSEVPRLTQAYMAGYPAELAIAIAQSVRPTTFNSCHMSSHEGDFFYEFGRGTIDARQIARVLLHYAASSMSVVSFDQLADDFIAFHHAVSSNATIWRNLVAFVTGSSTDKAQKPENMGRMPAEAVRERLVQEVTGQSISTAHLELFGTIESEYVISQLSQLGLIVPGTPLTYRISRLVPFPNFETYVDAVRAGVLVRLLEALSVADMSMVKAQVAKKQAISPSFIANQLASAAMRASDRVRGSYNALEVCNAVFYTLGTVWDPSTPKDMVAHASIQSSEGFSRLLANMTMFAAYQRRVATNGVFQAPSFSDIVMSKEIIPLFIESVERISPFADRTLAQAIGHMGLSSVTEFDATKSHIAVYESWNFSRAATAFVPVRNSRSGYGRFLMEEMPVSDAISSALGPIADTFAVRGFVERHLTALATAVPGTFDVKADGTEVLLALPSISAVPTPLGVTSNGILDALRLHEEFEPDETQLAGAKHVVSDSEEMGSDTIRAAVRRGEALLHSYYVALLALAIDRGGILTIGTVTVPENGATDSNLAIFWEVNTDSKIPFGPTALLGGRLETSEPVERLAYAPDVEPSLTITPPALPLGDHERSLHVWDWHPYSSKVEYNDQFEVTIANQKITVGVNEVDILSLGYRRDRLRFMIPASARAIAEMWVSWYQKTDEAIQDLKKQTQDSAAIAALDGRALSAGVLLVQRLRAIGRSPVGSNLSRLINSRVVGGLRKTGQIDAMKAVYTIPHQIRLEVWSGTVLLQMLGVLSDTDATALSRSLVTSNALATVMTMGLDEK